jgi:mitochondrial cardiolipin hydrolase
MKKVILFLFLFLQGFYAFPAIAETEAVFSPESSIKEVLLHEIGSTTSTIEIALNGMTSSDMARALGEAKQRGVKVRIIADSKQAKSKLSQITFLIQKGVIVKVFGSLGRGSMNYRFAVFDGKKVMVGSYDWSESSEKGSYENILFLEGSEAVAPYQKEFERLWREKKIVK